MKANFDFLLHELKANSTTFTSLLTLKDEQQALWKPSADKWCLLEIVCHLVDEEVFDFRTRIKTALYPKDYSFTPIDPVGWVTSKAYIKQDYKSKVAQWIREREASLAWLNALESPNWESFLVHDKLGKMSAGLFLENWVAHDFIHLRQIIRTKRAYLDSQTREDLSYAGSW